MVMFRRCCLEQFRNEFLCKPNSFIFEADIYFCPTVFMLDQNRLMSFLFANPVSAQFLNFINNIFYRTLF